MEGVLVDLLNAKWNAFVKFRWATVLFPVDFRPPPHSNIFSRATSMLPTQVLPAILPVRSVLPHLAGVLHAEARPPANLLGAKLDSGNQRKHHQPHRSGPVARQSFPSSTSGTLSLTRLRLAGMPIVSSPTNVPSARLEQLVRMEAMEQLLASEYSNASHAEVRHQENNNYTTAVLSGSGLTASWLCRPQGMTANTSSRSSPSQGVTGGGGTTISPTTDVVDNNDATVDMSVDCVTTGPRQHDPGVSRAALFLDRNFYIEAPRKKSLTWPTLTRTAPGARGGRGRGRRRRRGVVGRDVRHVPAAAGQHAPGRGAHRRRGAAHVRRRALHPGRAARGALPRPPHVHREPGGCRPSGSSSAPPPSR